jgi:RNA ligase (TIGR02306 family)
MSSDYKVPYTTILDIQPCPNADRLALATVYGWQVVIPKDKFSVGSKIIYVPIDSILPKNIEDLIFGPDAKVKLHNRRVRQIRLRGSVSQGMLVSPSEISTIVNLNKVSLETDLADILGITKYEPPVKESNGPNEPRLRKRKDTPNFHSYNGLQNIKWNTTMFKEGDEVVIQCKLHGTNSRAALLPYVPTTIWQKILNKLGLSPKVFKAYGSNRVDISAKSTYKGFFGSDIYGDVFRKIDVFSKLELGETVFGEIIGPGIQKGYSYGLKEHHFVLFDVKKMDIDGNQYWMSPKDVEYFAKVRGFEFVPVLYEGPYNKTLAYQLTLGPSEYGDKSEKVREGIVVKSATRYDIEGNKQALKWVSEAYLDDKTNTDDH